MTIGVIRPNALHASTSCSCFMLTVMHHDRVNRPLDTSKSTPCEAPVVLVKV